MTIRRLSRRAITRARVEPRNVSWALDGFAAEG
jgi:hypothetical protein